MKKNYNSIVSVLFLLGILGFIFFTMMPQWPSDEGTPLSEFSTQRAFKQVKNLSQKPHYIGTSNHELVAHYLTQELEKLGLETSFHEGFSFTDKGSLTYCKNILARIKGTNSSKALLLLSHYDSAPHSNSKGASDAGSGVATILESIRAFSSHKKQIKNDIIILFSDAEELGLNGAALFVTQHPWAKDVGLVLNFEARGSSGPSYMLMETNAGNAGLVNEFSKAAVPFPVSNSLMYSIYKMLPNDTDLTIFREHGNIQGYNFAFIDSHYNYHTVQDDLAHLDKKSLSHQGNYLMPLLDYFSNADLNATHSSKDKVYFSIPFGFISYPFHWVWPMVLIAFVLLLILIFIAKGKRLFTFTEIAKGFIPLFGSLLVAGLITFFGWRLLLQLYPQYNDLLHGFTYNGHDYIAAFTLLSLAICFAFYQRFSFKKVTMNHYIAPIVVWMLCNGLIAYYLKGAGFLIIPVYLGLLLLASFVWTQKSKWFLNLLLSIPTLLLIVPFILMFPIGLGLKMLFGSAVLTVFVFGLILPIFGPFQRKGLVSILLLLMAIGFFFKAHYNSDYSLGKAKPNSLVYILDTETKQAFWATYDKNLDQWTKKYLGQNPKEARQLNALLPTSKYNSGYTYSNNAPIKNIAKPIFEFLKDSIVGGKRYLKIRITPNRIVNRYDVFANKNLVIQDFKANGCTLLGQKGTTYDRKSKILVRYYVVNQMPLELEFRISVASKLELDILESSFDLMSNPQFSMTKRADWMMPTPFVLNDAVIVKQQLNDLVVRKTEANWAKNKPKDSLSIKKNQAR
jgi:hypothetical protein